MIWLKKIDYSWSYIQDDLEYNQLRYNTVMCFIFLAQILDLSLRDLQKIARYLVVLYKSLRGYNMPYIFIVLCILKIKYPKTFNAIKLKEKNLKESLTEIGIFKERKDFILSKKFKEFIRAFEKQVSILSMTKGQIRNEIRLINETHPHHTLFHEWMDKAGIANDESPIEIPALICQHTDLFTPSNR